MPTDVPQKKTTFLCEPSTIGEIRDALQGADLLQDNSIAILKRATCQIWANQIPWVNLRYLGILGKESYSCNSALKQAEFPPGIYINQQGNALILIHQDDDFIQSCVNRCGDFLQILAVYSTSISSIDISRLENLQEFYIGRNKHLSTILGTGNLRQLTKLYILVCDRITSLPGLEKLTQLTSLELIGCERLTSLAGLENLTQLTSLSLNACGNLMSLAGLENLSQLTSLCLSTHIHITTLPSLKNLSRLTSLRLIGCKELATLPGLENLSQLTHLELSNCYTLTALPGIENLSQLTTLDLDGCVNLTALPGLENLSQLRTLNLSRCQSLTSLFGLENLTQLTTLDLSVCPNFTMLPMDLHQLQLLRELNLREMHLQNLDGLHQLKSLRRLDLREAHLQDLPDWLPEIAERFNTRWTDATSGTTGAVVDLYRTTVEGVDMSIFEQPHDVILKWFKERKAGRTQSLNEMKVIFLGDGEAGKSYTISRLMNNGGDPLDYEGVRTPGIAIRNHPCKFGDREFTVNYWDFGGQEIMHSMHRVFLTNRTMYVVLVSVEDDDYQERAEYWLRNIKSFASEAPVVLAFNKVDMRPRLFPDEAALHAANGNLKQIVSMSALEFNQEQFESKFRSVLLQEIIKSGILDVKWPISWIELKSRMESIKDPHISVRAYEKMAKACQVEDVQIKLLHWFHDLGVSFCFRNNFKLKNQIILQPKWIINGLYIILFNDCKGVINGITPHKSIHELLENAPGDTSIKCTDRSAEYEIPRDAEYVLGIMRQFGLSLQIGEDKEFIPMLCQPHPTLNLAAYETGEEVLEFHMVFDYLPNNVLHQLMVAQYSELDLANVWRTGARFQQPGTGLSAVVAMDENTLKFFISSSDTQYVPQTYLTVIKAKIDHIWQKMGLPQPEESFVYKIGRKRGIFGCDELKYALQNGNSELYSRDLKRIIPIADLLCQFGLEGSASCEPAPLRDRSFTPPNLKKPSIDEHQLLEYLVTSCRNIQADRTYGATGDGSGKENQRNRRIRDDLKLLLKGTGYHVSDQSERGLSKSGQSSGELDILLEDENAVLCTVIEALRIRNSETKDWSEHLSRLLGNYNYAGLRVAYLVTYVDANEEDFLKIWKDYQKFIPTCNPGKYAATPGFFKQLNTDQELQYIQKAVCSYTCVSAKVTVYHLFVMVKPQPPKPDIKPKSRAK